MGYREYLQSLAALGAEFTDDGQGTIFVKYNNIKAEIDGISSLYTFREILIDYAYRVNLPCNCVVLDIGANDGFASLSFAAEQNVAAVYAFEPLAPTLCQLKRNIALNPLIAGKIHPLQYGISDESSSAVIRYSKVNRASLSLFWDAVPAGRQDVSDEPIVIRDISSVFSEVASAHPEQPIIIKLDCEGAERGIIRALVEGSLLGNVPIITGESHDLTGKDHQGIVAPLQDAGYTVFSHRTSNVQLGLFHAVQTRHS